MEIQEKLLKFKFHFLFALILTISVSALFYLAPNFATILAYFCPLFLSTTLFLGAVIFLGKTSSLPATDDKAGEGILDYVAAQPEHAVDSYKSE
ncbi:hypothetical protein HS088_TW19G00071 [Tripterygium wilfordii]|uniref:Transmembrane protein n=1 Tax=Tripterygium wilfordii TaxID=458696 RepID=A0A7J7C8K3_TRIWF|nr:hypothetical protein HS088_TW19G00071 [Tripterygium wilfordii]